MANDVEQQAADVIAAQAGRIAALIEAVRALIASHPDPSVLRAKLLDQVAQSPLAGIGSEATEPMMRGHREVTNYLTEAFNLGAQASLPSEARVPRAH